MGETTYRLSGTNWMAPDVSVHWPKQVIADDWKHVLPCSLSRSFHARTLHNNLRKNAFSTLSMVLRALEKLTPATATVSRFKAGDSMLQFLSKL